MAGLRQHYGAGKDPQTTRASPTQILHKANELDIMWYIHDCHLIQRSTVNPVCHPHICLQKEKETTLKQGDSPRASTIMIGLTKTDATPAY